MISREDIETKARPIGEAVSSSRETAKQSATWLAAGVVAVVLIAFVMGRRRGKQGGALVEVYKVK